KIALLPVGSSAISAGSSAVGPGETRGSGGSPPDNGGECVPSFEDIGYHKTLWPQPTSAQGLPTVVGTSTTWDHPGSGNYKVKVTKLADAAASMSMGATKPFHHRPEYARHDAFSADGTYAISHGITTRALYNAKTYANIRAVSNSGAVLGDWQWHPQVDKYAFYFDRDHGRVYRYDASDNTHTQLFDFETNPLMINNRSFTILGSWYNTSSGYVRGYTMAGEGSISADGSRVAVKMNTGLGGDGAVVVLNLDTQTVGETMFFAGKDKQSELDYTAISSSGDYVLVLGDFNDVYGTSYGPKQNYAFHVDDFESDQGSLVGAEDPHTDIGLNSAGEEVVVLVGNDAIVNGMKVYNLETGVSKELFNRELWSGYLPVIHVSMPIDGSGVALISTQRGGHPAEREQVQDGALIAIDVDTGQMAWLGWDEADNEGNSGPALTGPSGSAPGYLGESHATLAMDVEREDGTRTWKWAWASDNRNAGSTADYYIAELVCPADGQ
ncbi:MAG: hypothetical protein AAGA11_20550, partial [Pseudomonadota bacterium]